MESSRPTVRPPRFTGSGTNVPIPVPREPLSSPAEADGRSAPAATDTDGRPGSWRPLKIAMIGQKGVPATFGGVERHVEELGSRLAARGHEVTVYCRSTYVTERREMYRGMHLHYLPAVGTKHFDAISHSAVSTLAAMAAHSDLFHYHALGPGLLAPLPRYLSPGKVVVTVHGLDHERAKWNRAARTVLGCAHWMSGHVPDRTIVVSKALAEHYVDEFGCGPAYIPNGVEAPAPHPARLIRERFGLEPGEYVLFVGRLVPEKAPDLLIRAYRKVQGDRRLVIVGDSSFSDAYVTRLRALAAQDPRVLLAGYCFDDLLGELYANAAVFVLPSALEGLPLTLLEAVSYGLPVIVSDIPPHREVLMADGPGRRFVPSGDEHALALTLAAVRRMEDEERSGAALVREQVLSQYRWSDVTTRTEQVYLDLVGGSVAVVPAARGAATRAARAPVPER